MALLEALGELLRALSLFMDCGEKPGRANSKCKEIIRHSRETIACCNYNFKAEFKSPICTVDLFCMF